MGIKAQKSPLDLFIYQEILYGIRPDLIIETGTAEGGSAYYLAHMCDLLANGRVITIDNNQYYGGEEINRPTHPRITYHMASSVDSQTINYLKKQITPNMKVLVILDSDHKKQHVLEEINLYSKFVTKDSYLIVEDSCINGHPVFSNFGPGPMEAINEFLLTNSEFVVDTSREKFLMTFNPKGFL